MAANLAKMQRRSPEAVLVGLLDTNPSVSRDAGARLVSDAKDSGLSMQNYLRLAIDPRLSETNGKFDGLDGFEASLAQLNLPFRDDFKQGVLLQAASDSFQTYPGTRGLFPEVIDSMLRFKSRQDQIEHVDALVSQSRTISGTELISTTIDDDRENRGTFPIAEFGRIPVRTLRTSQTSVGIFKHGSGVMTSYEFERRASLDILTPFAARVARELEISKVKAATNMLLNGDGVNGAAVTESFSVFGGTAVNGTTSNLSTQYKAFARWMVAKAKAGTPIDTIVGNLDIYLELLFMFTPTINGGSTSQAAVVGGVGGPQINLNIPLLSGSVNFALSSSMPANKVLGFSKADTLEELIESGSQISENERSILNQSITYVRTENTGYKIAYGDTRFVLDLAS